MGHSFSRELGPSCSLSWLETVTMFSLQSTPVPDSDRYAPGGAVDIYRKQSAYPYRIPFKKLLPYEPDESKSI